MDDALEAMEKAQARPSLMVSTAPDWFAWRKKHADIWIAKTGEDGSLEHWQQLLRDEGATRLDNAILRIRRTLPKGNRINLSAVLAELQPDPVPDGREIDLASQRSRTDLLIWCVVHNPVTYADARCQWVDSGNTAVRVVPGYGEIAVRERICKQGTAVWEALRDRAAVAQDFIFSELGRPISPEWKPAVFDTVRNDPRWIGYLRSQKLIA